MRYMEGSILIREKYAAEDVGVVETPVHRAGERVRYMEVSMLTGESVPQMKEALENVSLEEGRYLDIEQVRG